MVADALLFAVNFTILNPDFLLIDAPVSARFPSVIPASAALAYPVPSTLNVLELPPAFQHQAT